MSQKTRKRKEKWIYKKPAHGPNDGPGDVGLPQGKWVKNRAIPPQKPCPQGQGERI